MRENAKPERIESTVRPERRSGLFEWFCALFLGKTQRKIEIQILLALLFAFALRETWLGIKEKLDSDERYLIGLKDIIVLSPPQWVPPTLVKEAIQSDSKLQGKPLTILDKNLGNDLYRAFLLHPWVRNVRSIQLDYPPRVLVDLEFRTPIAIVETGSTVEGEKVKSDIFQIDADGYLLPTDYLKAFLSSDKTTVHDYLWILGADSTPVGACGQSWGDPVLDEAALLAEFLHEDISSLGIQQILIPPEEDSFSKKIDEPRDKTSYRLKTRNGKEIIWGTFPMQGVIASRNQPETSRLVYETQKANAFEKEVPKLDELKKLAKEFGSLDDLPEDRYPIDVSDAASL